MTKLYQISLFTVLALIVVACGGGEGKEENPNLKAKKEELAKLKEEFGQLKDKITELEGEIQSLDPEAQSNEILVATMIPGKNAFVREIQLRGTVKSRRNVTLTAESMGSIDVLNVREGSKVGKALQEMHSLVCDVRA